MKRLIKTAILALAFIPGLALASHYKTESFLDAQSFAGTYYMGYAWVFYTYGAPIYYDRYHLEDDGSIKSVDTHKKKEWETPNQPACCVFQDKLYLFWRGWSVNLMYYAVFNGSDWSKSKHPGEDRYTPDQNDPFGTAAAVLNDRLFLFYQGSDQHIRYQYTTDGENWTYPELILKPDGGKVRTGGNMAATTFFHEKADGSQEQRIFLAWPVSDNTRIETMQFHLSGNETSLTDYQVLGHYAEGVALAEGSVDGAGTDKNTVQLFALGKRSPYMKYPYLRCEYTNDENGGTYSDWETVGHVSVGGSTSPKEYFPSAVTNYRVFGDNAHNLRQEIWMLHTWNVIRWESDMYVQVQDTSQKLYTEAYKKNWTMIGVVEGPPPYALNGRNPTSDSVADYSYISYAVQTDSAVSTSSTTKDEFFVSAGGPGEHWPGVGVSLTLGLEHHFCETQTHSEKLTHTFKPTSGDTAKFWVYRYYLRPTMRRLKYETRDWKGKSLDRYAYIFSISDYNLHVDAIDMRDSLPYDPRLWDPATYQDRHISADTNHYHIKAGRNINWVIGSEVELEISEETGLESSQSFTETIEIEVGMEGVFDIGVKGSITTEHSVSTDSINTVTVMNESPEPPGGFTGSYIKSFSFYPYWLEPKDSTPYWIPDVFKHQKPWCITYEVTEIEYDDMVSSGMAEDERPLTLKLYAVTPNPAGSQATIRYALPQATRVSLKVYDASGRMVKALEDAEQTAGVHSIHWNGTDDAGREMASGVYFCRLQTGDEHRIGRIVLIQ